MSIRVLIVDDQALVRAGFRMILDTHPDIEIVGEAGDGNEAVRLTQLHQPDVVLMDIRMPALDGIAATRILAGPSSSLQTHIVILTTYDLDEYVFDALAAGASGFLLKDVRPEDLVEGVRRVAAGDGLLAPSVTRRPGRPEPASVGVLTARELEVLVAVARGKSNAELARDLFVSENTIKTHLSHVLVKLGLRDRVQAVIYAYETGLVERGLVD